MFSLRGERLINPKGSESLLLPRSGHATAIMVNFAHLFILEHSDHHQNLISYSLYHPRPLHKISAKSIHSFFE